MLTQTTAAYLASQLLTGRFPAAVKRDGNLWNIDSDDGVLIVMLEKVVKTWWACVLEGDPEIDATKVDSTCKVSDYDEDTQVRHGWPHAHMLQVTLYSLKVAIMKPALAPQMIILSTLAGGDVSVAVAV